MKSGCQPETVPTHSSDPKLTIPNHNFMRFWRWMQAAYAPWTDEKMLVHPCRSPKWPGDALDGLPKSLVR